ncbi:uncharacterized protein LOC120255122 [Dioscorea cayenensis subsp. rotundata]|uniref:Uncharacterized protein LOC120255122 n=1 Tax=Dioscorea cayennensis subsp. rotundata TaxID=55577 RepID=A0AB40AVT5_DIOCR|nr:uncharacterized protein LOC120255122 [Dioscorea cayenensis subsp. rotundata]
MAPRMDIFAIKLRGLRQGDSLSLMLFALVMDVLSSMFVHALNTKVLVGVPLGEFGSSCLTGLETNFDKTCLYSSKIGELPEVATAETLSCVVGTLLVTYLGIPISRSGPHKKDWEGLILNIRRRLPAWKVWTFFGRILQLPDPPESMTLV